MTCKERFMKEHPECKEFDPGDDFIGCPMDYGYSTKHCSDYIRCRDCWNQPAIGVTVEEDEDKSFDCATCIHKEYYSMSSSREPEPKLDMVCGYGNSEGVLCSEITACDKYAKKIDESPNVHHKYAWTEEELGIVSPSELEMKKGEKVGEWFKEGIIKGMQDAAKASEGTPIKDLAKAISDIEKCQIKDSGERRQFETGAVRDIQEGKGRCDLLPLDVVAGMYEYNDDVSDPEHAYIFNSIYRFTKTSDTFFLYSVLGMFVERYDTYAGMLLEVSKHFEEGAKKYSENNWKKGIPTHCYIDSAVRHYLKYLRGDTDEPHDRAFVWNILCCIWTCIHKPELNDYRKAEEDVCIQN